MLWPILAQPQPGHERSAPAPQSPSALQQWHRRPRSRSPSAGRVDRAFEQASSFVVGRASRLPRQTRAGETPTPRAITAITQLPSPYHLASFIGTAEIADRGQALKFGLG